MARQDVSVLSVARQLDVRTGTHGVLPKGTQPVLTAYSQRYSMGTLESLEVLLPWSMGVVLLQAAPDVLAGYFRAGP